MKHHNRDLSPKVQRAYSSQLTGRVVMMNDLAEYISEMTYEDLKAAKSDVLYQGVKISKKSNQGYATTLEWDELTALYKMMPNALTDGKIAFFSVEDNAFADIELDTIVPKHPGSQISSGIMISEKGMETLIHQRFMFAKLKQDDEKMNALKSIKKFMNEAFGFLPDYRESGLMVVNTPIEEAKIKNDFNSRAKAALSRDLERESRMSRQVQIDAVTQEALRHEARRVPLSSRGFHTTCD